MLRLQDMNYSKSMTFHETYLDLTSSAKQGGGMFAFVTTRGIKLLLEDVKFEEMMVSIDQYTLIIGTDSITTDKTLDKFAELIAKYDGKLIVKAFYNKKKGRIFHPKLSWFKREEQFAIIIGSSNLTEGGLRKNIEGYFHAVYDNQSFSMIEDEWTNWIEENEENLLEISDAKVIEKCKLNKRKSSLQRRIVDKLNDELEVEEPRNDFEEIDLNISEAILQNLPEEDDEDEEDDLDVWSITIDSEVLVAEIPRSGNRWNQANFGKSVFENFFGATPGDNSQRILLKHITDTNTGETEIRPSISVKSNNYRFELDAAKHLDYPSEGTPIGIFVKVSVRQFLYTLLMPGDANYLMVKVMLQRLNENPGRFMRRETMKVDSLKSEVTNLPFWRLL